MTRRNWSTSAETMLDGRPPEAGRFRVLLSAIRSKWEAGASPDARTALAEHPEIAHQKTLVLELAYEEFCRRQEQGEDLNLEEFCEQFPLHRTSVRRRLEVHQFLARQLDAKPLTRWPAPPQQLCRFELVEEVGQGAIGRVYLARQAALGNRTVVLKVSKGGSREAHLLGRLDHPNVMPVYSVEDDAQSGLTIVCMPFLGLATFEDVLDQTAGVRLGLRTSACFAQTVQRLSGTPLVVANTPWRRMSRLSFVDALLTLFGQIADALAYLHEKGICHRDLKPSNILLADDARPMLLDFNLSAELAAAECRIGGTLPYMAPEQIRGMLEPGSPSPDGRADIFSMGVILFEMLTGALPFGAVSKNQSLERAGRMLIEHQAAGWDRQKLREAIADRGLNKIIARCLAYDPNDRFADAQAAAAALRRAMRPLARARRWSRAHPCRAGAAALLMAGVLLSGAAWFALQKPAWKRSFEQGYEALADTDYQTALTSFQEAYQGKPDYVSALLGIARARLALKQYSLAREDYRQLYELTRDAKYLACMGYCLSCQKSHADAIGYYQRAVQEGYKTEAVFNNCGLSHAKQSSFGPARDCFNQALIVNPRCAIARLNRARMEWLQVVSKHTPLPDSAVDDIEQAIRSFGGFGNLHYVAASLWLQSNRARRREAAIAHIERAARLGFPTSQIRHESLYRPLLEDQQMLRALACKAEQALSPDPNPLLNPDQGISDFF